MLHVSTLCTCGTQAVLVRTSDGGYRVTCPSCKRTTVDDWKTMTVAIYDWDLQVKIRPAKTA